MGDRCLCRKAAEYERAGIRQPGDGEHGACAWRPSLMFRCTLGPLNHETFRFSRLAEVLMNNVEVDNRRSAFRRWAPWVCAAIGVAALAWALRRFDLNRFRAVVANADPRFALLVPLTIIVEQIVRGWKWRQLLWPLRSIRSL